MHQITYNRRLFIKTSMMAVAGLMLPAFSQTGFANIDTGERRLRLYNIHTGESLRTCYWESGQYLQEEMADIKHFFRDFRTGDDMDMDLGLLDLLYSITKKAPRNSTINLISGYRSPETNQKLRKNTSGVAKKSYHMKGRAADIRIPGLATADLKSAAIALGRGGVGYYPNSDFVHVDTGPVRQW